MTPATDEELGEVRRLIARVIDPDAFAALGRCASYVAPESVPGHRARQAAVTKADEILALALPRILSRLESERERRVSAEKALDDCLDAIDPMVSAFTAYVAATRNFSVTGETSAERRFSEGEREDTAAEAAFEVLARVDFHQLDRACRAQEAARAHFATHTGEGDE